MDYKKVIEKAKQNSQKALEEHIKVESVLKEIDIYETSKIKLKEIKDLILDDRWTSNYDDVAMNINIKGNGKYSSIFLPSVIKETDIIGFTEQEQKEAIISMIDLIDAIYDKKIIELANKLKG